MPAFEGSPSAVRGSSGLPTAGGESRAAESDGTAAPLEIRLLGPFEVRLGGAPVAAGGGKRDALLAVLGLAGGRVVSVDELIDALWGEDLPAAPRNAVQHHVARLRGALGRERVVASPPGYALNDAWVDALRFEELLTRARVRLREGDTQGGAESVSLALALWRGPPLQGLTDTSWSRAAAHRLEALRIDALEEQFEAALAVGEHREIVPGVRTALEQSPFRERLWGQLMLALYRSGRQADALEAFQEARRILDEELGLEPGPELREVQEAILRQDPAIAPIPFTSRRRGNLPAAATSFIDREQELGHLVELLGERRLATLAGPPGVGKTRLAIEAGRSLETGVRDGAWLVEIARARGGADVARLVADALDVRGADPVGELLARLRDADAIILFDACEHALAEAARVIAAILADCPHVRVLATSREALHLAGEVRMTVGPLPLGDSGSADGAGSPAVQLFAARASAARPGFKLTDEATPIAADIARRADGLPLAIELAAARLNVLGLAELQSVLERRLVLLRGRAASDRLGGALQELVDWSYELLHADEKTLLHLIAVHRGGACLASLLALGAKRALDEPTVTYLLGALVDKSIVSVAFPEEEARYDLLDTVRDYTLQRLAESDRLAAARQAHAEYFATLAEGARTGLCGSDWLAWTKRLGREHDNLWAALTYARDAHDPDVAIRLGGSLGWYFSLAERVSEGRRFLELALSVVSERAPVALQVDLLSHLCFLATDERDLDAAIAAGERALSLAATAPTRVDTGRARAFLSLALAHSGDDDSAKKLAAQATEAFEAVGDHWGSIIASGAEATRAAIAGDLASAATFAASAVRHCEAIRYLALLPAATLIQAWVAERRGENEAAIALYRRAIEFANQAGFTEHTGFALARLGAIARERGDLREAEDLCRRALAAADAAPSPWTADYARVQLAHVFAVGGEIDAAARLYRNAIESSERPRLRRAHEGLQLVLAGSPGAAALVGLADLADARGDAAAAAELRARVALASSDQAAASTPWQ